MSLIADALKAAQQEKSKRIPAPSAAGMGGFFAIRSGARKDGIPRPVVLALVAVGAIGLVAALVTLLLSTTKTPPPLAATPVPLTPAPIVAPTVTTPAPLPITDSASAIPVGAAATQPTAAGAVTTGTAAMPTPVAAPILATGAPLVAVRPGARSDSTHSVLRAADTANAVAVGPRPPGTLKITMEDQPALDSRPLFTQALAAQRRGDFNRAKELYSRALDRDPQNADLYNNIGMLYKSTGELDRAEDAYRHAVNLNPRLAAAWSNLGVLLNERGRRKEAIAALQQAISVDPTNVGVKVNLALQYHASGLYADARRLLEEAVRASPTMAEAQYALARTLEAQGDRSSAIQHYDLFLSTSNGRFPQLERQVTQHLATLRAGS